MGYDFATVAYKTSNDGSNLFATGGRGSDYLTLAVATTTGAELWRASYNGPGNGFDCAGAVAVSPEGTRVFVTGSSDGAGTHSDYATIAHDTA